jgi:hypothetical protein
VTENLVTLYKALGGGWQLSEDRGARDIQAKR